MGDGTQVESAFATATRTGAAWPEPAPLHGRRNGPVAWAEYLAVRGLLGGLSRLPVPARRWFVEGTARVLRRCDRRRSTSAHAFLRQALTYDGREDLTEAELDRRVLQAWRHFLTITLEAASFQRRVPLARAAAHFELDVVPAARQILDTHSGAIVAVPHLGNWETFVPGFVAQGWGPVYVIAKLPKSLPLARHLQRIRERWGLRVVVRQGAMSIMPEVVERGGIVGMMIDQRARKRAVMAPFFGRTAPSERGAGVLLKRLRAPILVAACLRTSIRDQYRIEIPTVLTPEELAGLSTTEIVGRINAAMERMILAHPDQYFWLHDRYRALRVAPAPTSAPSP